MACCALFLGCNKHTAFNPTTQKRPRIMGVGINPYPLLSINSDTTPNQVFITNTAATAYITSNGAGVTTFFFPSSLTSSGTVTSVSVASANGLAGSVANASTTPAITLSTSITGLLKGNGTAISAQTTGNLTDGTADGITIGSGTGAVLGSGTTITQQAAGASANGYLTSGNWSTFNAKLPSTGVGLVEQEPGFIPAPSDMTYVLDQSASYAYTINTLIIATASGTTTAAIKINGTNVTGISAVSVSSSPATGTATAANSVSIGDQVTLVLSSSSSPTNMGFTMKYTR